MYPHHTNVKILYNVHNGSMDGVMNVMEHTIHHHLVQVIVMDLIVHIVKETSVVGVLFILNV
jgi:hypothetical protein